MTDETGTGMDQGDRPDLPIIEPPPPVEDA